MPSDRLPIPSLPNTFIAAALLLAAAACAPAERPAGPEPVVVRRPSAEYVFYDVTGDTPTALWESMRAERPGDLGTYFGRTEWNVTWRASWEGAGLCRVRTADVRLTMRIILPRWTPPPGASPELVTRWEAFLRALSEHEAGHADIAASAEREVRRALEAVTAPSCAMMESGTRLAAQRVLDDYRERNRQFDTRTRHGATEGAVWPPRAETQ
jgi:predicted secreted Zn-dependent protease